MNPDPLVLEAERVFEPQTLNLYQYAANNPLRFVDPTGNASVDAGLLAKVNNLRQTSTQFAVSEITAYRSGNAGNGTYDAQGSYLLRSAADAQKNLEDHANLQGPFDPQGQYDNALGGLVGYLEPQVQQSVMKDLNTWANDPSTSDDQIHSAMLKIAVADGYELPEPNDPHRKLRELSRSSWDRAIELGIDLVSELAPFARNAASMAAQMLDVNHQFRQSALSGLGAAAETKKPGANDQASQPDTSSCITKMSNSNPHPCDHF